MWLGLLYLPSDDGDEVILCAWEHGRERPFTVAGPLHAVPEMARVLREAAASAGTPPLLPRCDGCLQPLDLPLL
ncbi:MAG: hypothetical protein AVDCRST_MAG67-2520 [uncultured Solirubrobacteraceae bacterium]|uniref:Uncharacterized protein n=1 Tax=uncultured Solirubrobacteraceae bacterium TaxID=1162706 RepID=A0A6J4SX06_9ACTN|nr:MAG: hypothetical protein AVDCRST_MAG67-2520 [uncultured Solirubrobacteraceae bacterium]